MFRSLPEPPNVLIRPIQYRDLDAIDEFSQAEPIDQPSCSMVREKPFSLRRWYGILKLLSLFPNPFQDSFCVNVAEVGQRIRGLIQVSPFNRTGTTWRVDRIDLASPSKEGVETKSAAIVTQTEVGSLLLRYCLERIWQARTWILEIDVNEKAEMALYRHNGFQPLANMTYWTISPEQLHELADREPDLPNLLPVSNADAQLLYQLDTMAMPPLVRQVFDRHVHDFKTSLIGTLGELMRQWMTNTECVSGYVFEPQRKAAIGYFQVRLCRDGSQPHTAQLTVNPAYTWLYPELMAQMARITQDVPAQSLEMVSPDYQPEREAYLEELGATRIAHTLLMSRSVWHKVREAKSMAESLQIAEMLQGLQPSRKPVPGRISMLKSVKKPEQKSDSTDPQGGDPCC